MSSQAQAFVPAHTAYPHLRNPALSGRGGRPVFGQSPPVIYGAHGQPLNALPPQAPYAPDATYAHDGSPTDGAHDHSGRRRGPDEPRTPTLPPPMTGGAHAGRLSVRRGSSTEYSYMDASGHRAPASPASSTASYQPPYPHPPASGSSSSPYYVEPGRTPPQQYAFEGNRNSSSPRESTSTASGGYAYPGLHPPLALPPRGPNESTPPPHHTSASRQRPPPPEERRSGMSIQNLLDQTPGQGQGGRSATDQEMLKSLMPRRGI